MLWLLAEPTRLSRPAAQALASSRATALLSAVVLWEAAIKSGLGKLDVQEDLPAVLAGFAFVPLPVTLGHAWAVGSLPRHHRDPFDRLLVAQARAEEAHLVTADSRFAAYDVDVIW